MSSGHLGGALPHRSGEVPRVLRGSTKRGMDVDWHSSLWENTRTQELLIVCVLTLLALATRVYGIWEWPITGDEYFTIANFEDRATGLIGSAYYALGLLSQTIFGPTNWSARLPAVVLGVLSIPAFYLMCRSMFNRRAAAIGCIFVILSEWHLYHSQMARFYSGVFLFAAISYYLYYISLDRGSYLYLSLSLAASLSAVSFHVTSIFIVASCGAHSMFLLVSTRDGEGALSQDVAKVYLSVCVLAGVTMLPKFLSIAGAWGVGYQGLTFDVLSTMLGVVENTGVPVFVSAFLGLVYLYFARTEKFSLFVILTIIPILSVLAFAIFLPPARPRYMFYSLPLVFALSSFFCVGIFEGFEGHLNADIGVAVVISSVVAVSFLSYYSGRLSLDVRDPVKYVEENYKSSDQVVVFGWSIRHQLDDGIDVSLIKSKSFWERRLVPIAEEEGRTWVIIDTYRTAPLRQDLEAWLMENASLRWRKEEARFDYTQRGYEVWLKGAR